MDGTYLITVLLVCGVGEILVNFIVIELGGGAVATKIISCFGNVALAMKGLTMIIIKW